MDPLIIARIKADKAYCEVNGYRNFNAILACPANLAHGVRKALDDNGIDITVVTQEVQFRGRVAIKVYLYRSPHMRQVALSRTMTYPDHLYDGMSRIEHLR